MKEKINGKEYESIKIYFSKEEFKEIQKHLKQRGITKISMFIKMLIYEEMKGR